MANRHKHHAKGGGVEPKKDDEKEEYNAQGSHVMEEAKEKKRGGKVKRKEGGKVPGFKSGGRLDKYARGGRTKGHYADGGMIMPPGAGAPPGGPPMPPPGMKPPGMMKRGGRAGGDMTTSPFSSAHVKSHTPGGNPSPHKHGGRVKH
jgi:hypothetical protein